MIVVPVLLAGVVASAVSARATGDGPAVRPERLPALVHSASPDRSAPAPLDGARLPAGDEVAIFVAPLRLGADRVDFYLNGDRIQTDSAAPFDLGGTARDGSAVMVQTDEFRDGKNELVAAITSGRRSFKISAAFAKVTADPGEPRLDLQLLVNGEDANEPPGPGFGLGEPLTFTYRLTNRGDTPLTDILVVDAVLGRIACVAGTLTPGDGIECTAAREAGRLGPHRVVAGARATSPSGRMVGDRDLVHFTVAEVSEPLLDLQTFVNGDDANEPPGPAVAVGDELVFRYRLINRGDTLLTDIVVEDETLGPIDCPNVAGLQPGEIFDCPEASSIALFPGQQSTTATASAATPDGSPVSDTDSAYYNVIEGSAPAINLVTTVNGEDANTGPGPDIEQGDPVRTDFTITNDGNVPLNFLAIAVFRFGDVPCDAGTLQPGESFDCPPLTVTAGILGEYTTNFTVRGVDPLGTMVTDSDPINFVVVAPSEVAVEITGTLLDVDGQPVVGARANLFELLDNGQRGQFIVNGPADDGDYRIVPPAGCYVLVLATPEPSGYTWLSNGSRYEEHRFCLEPGETLTIDNTLIPDT